MFNLSFDQMCFFHESKLMFGSFKYNLLAMSGTDRKPGNIATVNTTTGAIKGKEKYYKYYIENTVSHFSVDIRVMRKDSPPLTNWADDPLLNNFKRTKLHKVMVS